MTPREPVSHIPVTQASTDTVFIRRLVTQEYDAEEQIIPRRRPVSKTLVFATRTLPNVDALEQGTTTPDAKPTRRDVYKHLEASMGAN